MLMIDKVITSLQKDRLKRKDHRYHVF